MESVGSWALCAAMITLTIACTVMVYRIFSLRHSFDIAARSPALLCIAVLCNLALANVALLSQVLRLEGRGLPCYAMFWSSYLWCAGSSTAYSFRACSLLIVYDTSYRRKFAGLVKSRALVKSWALSIISVLAYSAAMFANMQDRYARGNYGCFFFQEKRSLEIAFGCCIIPVFFILFKLRAVNDAFGIRPEMCSVFFVTFAGGVLHISLLELVAADILPTSSTVHTADDMIILVVSMNVLFWGAVVPISFHRRFVKRRVAPLQASGRRYHAMSSVGDQYSWQIDAEGGPACLSYAREGGDLATLFGAFCKRYLCEESWDFLLEAVAYEEMSQLHEQHAAFISILDKYLRSTSPQEVNIDSAMKVSMAKFQNIESFSELDEAQRRGILGPPAHEISRMLGQNLLNRFRETPEMQLRLERERRENVEMEQAEQALEVLQGVSLGSSIAKNTYWSKPPHHGT